MIGAVVNDMRQDQRGDRNTILMCARTGHLGPAIFRSTDGGKTWKESSKPPAFIGWSARAANGWTLETICPSRTATIRIPSSCIRAIPIPFGFFGMQIHIPTPLRAYTKKNIVAARGATLAELFADLERRFPDMRFRVINEQDEIREHIKVFVNQTLAVDLRAPLKDGDSVHIIAAISGG